MTYVHNIAEFVRNSEENFGIKPEPVRIAQIHTEGVDMSDGELWKKVIEVPTHRASVEYASTTRQGTELARQIL
jgi:hypothetical protein